MATPLPWACKQPARYWFCRSEGAIHAGASRWIEDQIQAHAPENGDASCALLIALLLNEVPQLSEAGHRGVTAQLAWRLTLPDRHWQTKHGWAGAWDRHSFRFLKQGRRPGQGKSCGAREPRSRSCGL